MVHVEVIVLILDVCDCENWTLLTMLTELSFKIVGVELDKEFIIIIVHSPTSPTVGHWPLFVCANLRSKSFAHLKSYLHLNAPANTFCIQRRNIMFQVNKHRFFNTSLPTLKTRINLGTTQLVFCFHIFILPTRHFRSHRTRWLFVSSITQSIHRCYGCPLHYITLLTTLFSFLRTSCSYKHHYHLLSATNLTPRA